MLQKETLIATFNKKTTADNKRRIYWKIQPMDMSSMIKMQYNNTLENPKSKTKSKDTIDTWATQ